MRTLIWFAPLLCAVAACGGEPPREGPPEIPGPAGRPTGADTPDVVLRFAGRVADSLRIRRGACPFECCTYREWTAREPLPLFAAERAEDAAPFTIAAGQRFRADSGNVHITGILVVAVADTVSDGPYWAFGPGDTLVVLDYLGEGHYHVWHDGVVSDVAGFWGAESPRLVAETVGRWESEWWVHVTTEDGRTGWIRASTTSVAGADRCA